MAAREGSPAADTLSGVAAGPVRPEHSGARAARACQPPSRTGSNPARARLSPAAQPPKSAPLHYHTLPYIPAQICTPSRPAARGTRGPPARLAAHRPAAAGTRSPPTRPARRPALSLPPRRAPSTQCGMACRGGKPPTRALEGGSSPAASCPLRAYTPIPPYARVWVCVRGCVGVCMPVHMHMCATHRLLEWARRLFLLRHGVPSHTQHNRCRRPHCRAMRPFLAPRIRHIYMEK